MIVVVVSPFMRSMLVRLRFSLILALACALPIIGISSNAAAQWGTTYAASASIQTVKVLDEEGAPNTILLGLVGGEIDVSNDGGATFTVANTVTITGTVTDFSFMDADTGFASVIQNGALTGLMKTTDGGQKWDIVPTAPRECNDVYYHKSTGVLFVSSATDSAAYSTDRGQTWTNFCPVGMTGFAFAGDNLGILASASSVNGQPYYRTTDGGKTWNPTSMRQDGWQPVGIAKAGYFFVSDPVPGSWTLYSSYDGGQTWFVQFSFIGGSPTGTVRGDFCGIYASAGDLLYASSDDGKNWLSMPASPGALPSTRFYVTATKIFATDGKNLDTTSRTAPAPIHVAPPQMLFRTADCIGTDTVIYLHGCDCGNIQLAGATLIPVSSGSATGFTVTPGPNRPICGDDSIRLTYHSTSNVPDTADVQVHLIVDGSPSDTTIRVYGPGLSISVTPSARNFIMRMHGCEPKDTILYLTNNLCNTLTLVSVSMDDQTHVQTSLPYSLPATINPRQSLPIPIHASVIKRGTYNYVLTYVVQADDGSLVTQSVGVTLLVDSTPSPDIRGLNWTIENSCAEHDTAVYYFNTLCDTVTIYGLTLQNTTNFKIPSFTFPIRLAPGESLRIPVQIIPANAGIYSTKLSILSHIEDVEIDSTLNLYFKINSTLEPNPTVSPNGALFGAVSTCDSSRELTMHFANNLCIPITVDKLVYTVPADSTYTFPYHFAEGITLQPGQSDSIIVHFWPKISGGNGSIQATYSYRGQTKTVLYAVSGVGSDRVTASLADAALNFDSLRYCDTKELTTTLTNGPCASIIISNIRVLSGSGFTITNPKIGDTILTNEAKTITVDLAPTSSGDITGAIEIQITNLTGQVGVSDTLQLTAHVAPPVRNAVLSSIASDTLLACATRDTTATITNNGECDTIAIAGIVSSNPNVTVTNAAALTGTTLAVGQTATIQLHFDPANITADLIGTITIHATPDIVIPYDIPVKSCATSPAVVTLTVPDSTFSTPNCTSLTREFAVYIDKDQTTIDSLALSALNTKFGTLQIEGGKTLPYLLKAGDTLKFTLSYDADATGSDTVFLHVHSADGLMNRTLELIGITTGAPTQARLGIAATAGGNTINTVPSTTQLTSVTLIMRDPVASALGMNSAHFHVQYNRDVLTEVKVTPAAGWSLTSDAGTEGDRDITLSYSGGNIAAGDAVATVAFLPSLSTVTTTNVTVAETHFNQSDPNFERCKVSLNNAGEAVTVNVGMSCSDSMLQRAMLGQPIVSELSIIPNPTGKSHATTIAYHTAVAADVAVQVFNLSGAVVAESTTHATIGDHSLVLPAASLESGTYFVRVTAGGTAGRIARFTVR